MALHCTVVVEYHLRRIGGYYIEIDDADLSMQSDLVMRNGYTALLEYRTFCSPLTSILVTSVRPYLTGSAMSFIQRVILLCFVLLHQAQ